MVREPRRLTLSGGAGLWVFAALVLFYAPTIYDLASHYWASEEQAYSPIVAIAVFYLFWSLRARVRDHLSPPRFIAGFLLLAAGLLIYVVGRSQGLMAFEAGSALPVTAGAALAIGGNALFRLFWFPIFYLIFLIPLPNMFVDAVTGPLKVLASNIAESLLYALDYPIARNGVTLTVGKYQLLVADACSGLRSIFSLFALGLIYLHLLQRRNFWHNALLILCIIPIALATNTLRVLMLVLIIYHYGEQVGMGAVHGLSGLLTFVTALSLFMALDSILHRRRRSRRQTLQPAP